MFSRSGTKVDVRSYPTLQPIAFAITPGGGSLGWTLTF
jgi:hypothetical protein